jgi:hypothetical protein
MSVIVTFFAGLMFAIAGVHTARKEYGWAVFMFGLGIINAIRAAA